MNNNNTDLNSKQLRGIDVYLMILDSVKKPIQPVAREETQSLDTVAEITDVSKKCKSNKIPSVAVASVILLNSIFANGCAIADENYKNIKKNSDVQNNKSIVEEMQVSQEYNGDTFSLNEEGMIVPQKGINEEINEKIEEERRKSEEGEVSVYWINPSELRISANGNTEVITPEDAVKKYEDNKAVLEKINSLLSKKTNGLHADFSESNVIKKEYDIEAIKAETSAKIDKIIEELQLQLSEDPYVQLKNCCLVQKYIIEHNDYNKQVMDEKTQYPEEELTTIDLYNAVVLESGVCTSNALMFKSILGKVGVKAEVIALTDKSTGGMHASNIVLLNGQYYFFDSTLDSTIYQSNKELSGGKVMLCVAGLGSADYCQFYNPEVMLPENPLDLVLPIPTNIAIERIPAEVVNELIEPEPNYPDGMVPAGP